jgi:light-regulated signal transduction histidine kinase (bacteriophytochrome)
MHPIPLNSCEQEALHLSGVVQAHGALLVVDAQGKVTHASTNIYAFLEQPAERWLGQPLPKHLQAYVDALPDAAGSRMPWSGILESVAGCIDLSITRGEGGKVTLEVTRHRACDQPDVAPFVAPFHDQSEYRRAQQQLVETIAQISGFQRVMYYHFHENADGEVIAEARREGAYGSFLGHRFPASDIPRIARNLYMKNPWRLIPDAQLDPVPIASTSAAPPDLTWSDLRSVSPVHRAYLGNMQVRASLSFPVMIGGSLSALVACHHSKPAQPPLAMLEALARSVHAHAMAASSFLAQQRMRMLDGMNHHFDQARHIVQRHGDLLSAWPELGPWLMQAFQADGATLCIGEMTAVAGSALEPQALQSLRNSSHRLGSEAVWSSDSLSREWPGFPLSATSGALCIHLSKDKKSCIFLCRGETLYDVVWGGNPEKPVEVHEGLLNISPRRSFEKWVEKRMGYSRPWSNECRLMALKLREFLSFGSAP